MQDIETEVNKEDPVIDRLREVSALLSEQEETLLELDVGIEERTDTDDLENEIADVEEYKEANQVLSELWQAIKDPQLLEYFSGKSIVWRFIVERAAWWGGFWERLVRSLKTCLRKVLGSASLTFEEMSTLLTEVEATLNARPLTFVRDEVDEPQPLTPAHFLVGERLTALPPKPFPVDNDHLTVSKEEMTRRWRYRNRLMTNPWNCWWKDYLLDLKSAHSCSPQKPTELKTGDIVLIGDANVPRQTWKLGKIEELFPG
ncbi:pao retrotransposon peptidase superfamily [Labeo rohita]|uniref:Pao retrotransposon peptidase superfamily n=1 Tax=Labeo rohita TaxID=84645 RepID=A0A498NZ31_LABRO|nr:pao retrotransposon peptidase superfamily [Labeo rohita]RXN37173.1 pao retrotransposon peptidase superfamily [Labeo rohita]